MLFHPKEPIYFSFLSPFWKVKYLTGKVLLFYAHVVMLTGLLFKSNGLQESEVWVSSRECKSEAKYSLNCVLERIVYKLYCKLIYCKKNQLLDCHLEGIWDSTIARQDQNIKLIHILDGPLLENKGILYWWNPEGRIMKWKSQQAYLFPYMFISNSHLGDLLRCLKVLVKLQIPSFI